MECLQESVEKKRDWLTDAMQRVPLFVGVLVVRSDVPALVGQEGVVVGYDVGTTGEWPTVRVGLASGITESFYCDGSDTEDEVEKL